MASSSLDNLLHSFLASGSSHDGHLGAFLVGFGSFLFSGLFPGLPLVLIMDGKVMVSELKKAKLSEAWLRSELEIYGIKSPSEVLIASLNTQGELFFQAKES
jgi:uncharacterized membrane protein YcaP (DUF421 family)